MCVFCMIAWILEQKRVMCRMMLLHCWIYFKRRRNSWLYSSRVLTTFRLLTKDICRFKSNEQILEIIKYWLRLRSLPFRPQRSRFNIDPHTIIWIDLMSYEEFDGYILEQKWKKVIDDWYVNFLLMATRIQTVSVLLKEYLILASITLHRKCIFCSGNETIFVTNEKND